MKFFLLLPLFLLSISRQTCKSKTPGELPEGCYKGKLEVKGGCMNYTISIQSKNFNPAMVERSWTDETNGKIYKNVFGLGSRCTFPNTINEGDEFYFTIDSTSVQVCAVCLMYYPTPQKKLLIKVLNGPCNK